MKNKRKVGEKAQILVDSIDLEILETLQKYHNGIGVLELAEKLNIQHKNLKPHLAKLIKVHLIVAGTKESKSRKISLILPENLILEGDREEVSESMYKVREEQIVFLNKLFKIRGLNYEKETLYEISRELESKKNKK